MVFRAHISLLLLLIYSVFSKDASFNLGQLARDDSLVNILGEWEGALSYQPSCTVNAKSCAFQMIFSDDETFSMRLGPGCFVTSQSCASEGNIVNVTQDTVIIEYKCSTNTGCYCEDDSSTLQLCWKYKKETAMRLQLAVHISPSSLFSVCPDDVKESCDSVTGESVALGSLECGASECLVCQSETTCNGKGKCSDNGECRCFPSWSGPYCNISACEGGCNGHGLCGDISITNSIMGISIFDESKHAGVCRCFNGYSGKSCNIPDIYDKQESLWLGLIYAGVISTVITVAVLLKKISRLSVQNPRRRHRRGNTIEVELDRFMNPL